MKIIETSVHLTIICAWIQTNVKEKRFMSEFIELKSQKYSFFYLLFSEFQTFFNCVSFIYTNWVSSYKIWVECKMFKSIVLKLFLFARDRKIPQFRMKLLMSFLYFLKCIVVWFGTISETFSDWEFKLMLMYNLCDIRGLCRVRRDMMFLVCSLKINVELEVIYLCACTCMGMADGVLAVSINQAHSVQIYFMHTLFALLH